MLSCSISHHTTDVVIPANRRERKTTLAQNSRPTNIGTSSTKTAAPARKMGKPKTPEEERAAAARREAIMKAFSQTAAPKAAPRLSDVSTSSSTRSSNAIDQMLSGMDTGTRKRDTSLAPWAGEYVKCSMGDLGVAHAFVEQ
jgi:hypothetical protein